MEWLDSWPRWLYWGFMTSWILLGNGVFWVLLLRGSGVYLTVPPWLIRAGRRGCGEGATDRIMEGLGALLFIDGIFLGGLIFLCLLRYGLRRNGYVNDSVGGSWVIQALAYVVALLFGLWLAAIVAVILVDEGQEAPFWLIVAFGMGCGCVLARVGLTVSWYFTEWIYARIDE